MRLTTFRVLVVVVALAATTASCGLFGCDEARLVVDPVSVVRSGEKVPEVPLRARLTTPDGAPLSGAEIQFTLDTNGDGTGTIDNVNATTDSDGVAYVNYGEHVERGLHEPEALRARFVSARLTNVIGKWSEYCETAARAPFSYRT